MGLTTKSVIICAFVTLLSCIGYLHPRAQQTKPKDGKQEQTERVSYNQQIAPILALNCSGCHSKGEAWWGVSVSSYQDLMNSVGRDSHRKVITPRDSQNSVLVQRIEGSEHGTRMPFNQQPLSPKEIQLIKKWIDQGAKLDEGEPALEHYDITIPEVAVDISKTITVACRVPIKAVVKVTILDMQDKPEWEFKEWSEMPNEWYREGGCCLGYGKGVKNFKVRLSITHERGVSPVGAIFVVTQGELDSSGLNDTYGNSHFDPNPAYRDKVREGSLMYWLDAASDVTGTIWPDRGNAPVYRFYERDLPKGLNRHKWDFKTSNGSYAPTGKYIGRLECKSREPNKPQYDIAVLLQIQ
jgi:hypothetical protein